MATLHQKPEVSELLLHLLPQLLLPSPHDTPDPHPGPQCDVQHGLDMARHVLGIVVGRIASWCTPVLIKTYPLGRKGGSQSILEDHSSSDRDLVTS